MLIQRFRKSPFSPETETFENGFESGDFRKRRLTKTLRCRVERAKTETYENGVYLKTYTCGRSLRLY